MIVAQAVRYEESHAALLQVRSADITNYHFQCTFAQACSTIVSGGVAERIPMSGYLLFSMAMCAFIYPFVVSQTWGGGFLAEMGFVGIAHWTEGVGGSLAKEGIHQTL